MEIQDVSTSEVKVERTGVEGRNRSRPQYVIFVNSMYVGQRKHLCLSQELILGRRQEHVIQMRIYQRAYASKHQYFSWNQFQSSI